MVSIEFYNTPDGLVMYKPINGPVQELNINSREIIAEMIGLISERYPAAFEALSKLYSVNELNRFLYEYNIVSRFCRCNFGEYDALSPDIDGDGFFHFEEVGCPLRGECRYEGVICKPKINSLLTPREQQVIELISKGKQAQEIADELFISAKTVCRHRENIKAKLNIKTIAGLSSYYIEHIKGRE